MFLSVIIQFIKVLTFLPTLQTLKGLVFLSGKKVPRMRIHSTETTDLSHSFGWFDKVLFNRFSSAVAHETNLHTAIEIPNNYTQLIDVISRLTVNNAQNLSQVSITSRNILLRLFPPGLLPTYKRIFSSNFCFFFPLV